MGTFGSQTKASHGHPQIVKQLSMQTDVVPELSDFRGLCCGLGVERPTSPLRYVASQAVHCGMDRATMGAGCLGINTVSGNVESLANKFMFLLKVCGQLLHVWEQGQTDLASVLNVRRGVRWLDCKSCTMQDHHCNLRPERTLVGSKASAAKVTW